MKLHTNCQISIDIKTKAHFQVPLKILCGSVYIEDNFPSRTLHNILGCNKIKLAADIGCNNGRQDLVQ